LDENHVDKLFSDINRACEVNSSRYNQSPKRILISADDALIDNMMNKENSGELKETVFKDEFMDMYEPHYTLDQVYIGEEEKKQILTVLNIKKHEEKMYKDWGFEETSIKNRSVVFNFFGEPGTGKSMAAEAVGKYLGKKIYSINYAELESKYVGQTPKNIKKAFEKASEDDAVLVFEEADSFLGKRLTDISQSADYGVNITRSVMLLELEKFEGVVIFTTNLLNNYDEAFKRRILASVEFKMPDEAGRKAIFDIHMPKKMPLEEGVNSEVLAKEFTDVSGADIKDIIFMAAVTALERCEKEKNESEDDSQEDVELFLQPHEEVEEMSDDQLESTDGTSEENEDDSLKDKIVIDAEKVIEDDAEASEEVAATVEEVVEVKSQENSSEEDTEQFVTLEDFRLAYKDIKNRYRKR
ncbi:MAG: AAA family ATPase, partial [Romboutsia sp.]|nr:AAA family ATPase [Romboutsia sp.]